MDVFAALADSVRRELLRALAAGPARVVDLAAAQTVSRPAVSRHLRVLTEAGLAAAEDRGRERHYRLRAEAMAPVLTFAAELRRAAPFAESALDGLELEVRRTGRERHADRAVVDPTITEETA
ncbi:helix-turn-helix transcriptional regulator [Nocardioides sp. cx-173]|uniref:ArsR/SmtB family transcription factor n=1 Tax=Nocardioides sp. cx-173 TaxID=2898796 RepID=UPI001E54A685|nr:metalloregulator ArsR/SmtB family transcription factor [Nocardioides sp. cx-173]MCD4525533.1 metalloregulator ArsR/SmtB family transcription factor [Nocardioides sp. cx-173]UGB42677.1 metalloregulator ArsR/SmtB family transcription factor [Nocardioides sp. cx-173]